VSTNDDGYPLLALGLDLAAWGGESDDKKAHDAFAVAWVAAGDAPARLFFCDKQEKDETKRVIEALLEDRAGREGTRLALLRRFPRFAAGMLAIPDPAQVVLAIDAPLAWPKAMVKQAALRRSESIPEIAHERLQFRVTERFLKEQGLGIPQSAVLRSIGGQATKAQAVIRLLCDEDLLDVWRGNDVPRDFAVVEVYPAASLRSWGLPHKAYKGDGENQALRAARRAMIARAVCRNQPGFFDDRDAQTRSLLDGAARQEGGDELDACIAALTGVAALRDAVYKPSALQRHQELWEHRSDVCEEGWIAVPRRKHG
jgi:predicted nuclease with RNAse H fold